MNHVAKIQMSWQNMEVTFHHEDGRKVEFKLNDVPSAWTKMVRIEDLSYTGHPVTLCWGSVFIRPRPAKR